MADWTVTTGGDPLVNGDNFQSVLTTDVQPGDRIILQAGASYQTRATGTPPNGSPFNLPNKGGSSFITIESTGIGGLPAGVRVTPGQVSSMAQLATNGSNAVIHAAPSAGWYRFRGIEFTTTANLGADSTPANRAFASEIVNFLAPAGGFNTWFHDAELDRCWVHPYEVNVSAPWLTSAAFGIHVEGANLTVRDSWISDFTGFQCNSPTTPAQSTGWVSVGGPGPLTLTNCYVEAWYANAFTGGGSAVIDPANVSVLTAASMTDLTHGSATLSTPGTVAVNSVIRFLVAAGFTNQAGYSSIYMSGIVNTKSGSDITFTLYGPDLPPSTTAPDVPGSAKWDGLTITGMTITRNTFNKRRVWAQGGFSGPKAWWEMKKGVNVLFSGNRLQGCPGAAPINPAFQRNQDGSDPWARCSDNTFSHILAADGSLTWFVTSLFGQYHTIPLDGGNVLVTNCLLGGGMGVDTAYVANGTGTGAANQTTALAVIVYRTAATVVTVAADTWIRVGDFLGSGPTDKHYVVNQGFYRIDFGNGTNGANPANGAAIVATHYGGRSYNVQMDGGTSSTYSHNTIRGAQGALVAGAGGNGNVQGLVFKDNIVDPDTYFWNGVASDWPSRAGGTNVVILNGQTPPPDWPTNAQGLFSGDFRPANDAAVGFVNAADADAGGDYHGYALTVGSAYHNAASDGKDVGVDFAALDAALGPAVAGPATAMAGWRWS